MENMTTELIWHTLRLSSKEQFTLRIIVTDCKGDIQDIIEQDQTGGVTAKRSNFFGITFTTPGA